MSRLSITLLGAALLLGACKGSPDAREDGAPAEVKAPSERWAHDLPEGGALGTLPEGMGVPLGESAPKAEMLDLQGEAVTLEGLWSQGPVALIFYRGGWCPYCSYQIHELSVAYADFEARGVTPVLVSVDLPDPSAETQATYQIPFPVLSDADLSAHKAFRVLNVMDEKSVRRYRLFGVDLEERSGEAHHTIAVPSIFLIDAQGVVRWAHADTDFQTRPSPAQILAAIDSAGLGAEGGLSD